MIEGLTVGKGTGKQRGVGWALGLAWVAMAWGSAGSALATPTVIEAVQAPVWVDRGEQRLVAVPGLALTNRDRLVTGDGARAILRLADGTLVRLGPGSRAVLNALGEKQGGEMTAALDVQSGAFRLTGDGMGEVPPHHAINVRAGQLTASSRGDDRLWGHADATGEAVCLQEGNLVVTQPEGGVVALNQPLQCYGVASGESAGKTYDVTRGDFALAALAVDIQEGPGSLRRGGRWAVRLAVLNSEAEALALYDRALAAGFAPQMRPRRVAGGYRYELRVGQVADQREAERLAARLAEVLNLAGPKAIKP